MGRAHLHRRVVRDAVRRHPVVLVRGVRVHHRRRASHVHGGEDAVSDQEKAAGLRGRPDQHPERGDQRHARHQVLRVGKRLRGARARDSRQGGEAHLGVAARRRAVRRGALLHARLHRRLQPRVLLARGEDPLGVHRVHRAGALQHAPVPADPGALPAHDAAQRAQRRAAPGRVPAAGREPCGPAGHVRPRARHR